MDLPALSTQKDQAYRDFLLHLEENLNVETLLKMSIRIEELENKLHDQHQIAQKRELELHKQFDQKKYKWIFKYLEIKLQLEKLKETNNQTQKTLHQDLLNLCNTVHLLLKKLKEKDDMYLNEFRSLEKDIADSMTSLLNPPNPINKAWDLEQFSVEEEGPLPLYLSPKSVFDGKRENKNYTLCKKDQNEIATNNIDLPMPTIIDSNGKAEEFSIDSEIYIAAVGSKQDQERENATPQTLGDLNKKLQRDFKGYFKNIYKDSTAHTRSASLNSISPLTSFMEPIQKKISGYINKIMDNRRNFDNIFEEEIKRSVYNIEIKFKQDQSFLVSYDKSLNREKSQRIFSNQEVKRSNKENNISKVYTILENNITPMNQQKKIIERKSSKEKFEKSNRVVEKLWATDEIKESHNKVENDLLRILQELQNSLTLSDREVVLNTLMNAQEKGIDLNDIKLEELLAVPTCQSNNLSVNGFTPSLCLNRAAHIQKDFGQLRNYSSYDRGIPIVSKSSQIIHNNLSQRAKELQMSIASHDIIDARKYLDSYYNRDYFRNESEECIERSEMNSHVQEVSELRNFREKIMKENMSPILPQKEKSRHSRMNIFEEKILENFANERVIKENEWRENISKPDCEIKISSETNRTTNGEWHTSQIDSNKQGSIGKGEQDFENVRNKEKQNPFFCFRVCGNK